VELRGGVSQSTVREVSTAVAALEAFLVAHPLLYPSNPEELTMDVVCGQTMWRQWAAFMCFRHTNERTRGSLRFSTVKKYMQMARQVMKTRFEKAPAGGPFFGEVGSRETGDWFNKLLDDVKVMLKRGSP